MSTHTDLSQLIAKADTEGRGMVAFGFGPDPHAGDAFDHERANAALRARIEELTDGWRVTVLSPNDHSEHNRLTRGNHCIDLTPAIPEDWMSDIFEDEAMWA